MKAKLQKGILIVLSALLSLSLLGGCGAKEEKKGVTVVCTIFPLYDWARQLTAGTETEVKLLADNGADLHSYQPSAEDVIEIATCDLLIMVGGASDRWVEEILNSQPGEDRRVCRVSELEGITLRQISEESTEDTCAEEDCHDHDHDHEMDEHLWLSLKNAVRGCEEITEELKKLDEANSEIYDRNRNAYAEQLLALDTEFREAAEAAQSPSVVFADRFPFVYLMEDYGIRYRAAFRGCTTETDADFDTICRLAEQVDQWGLSFLMTTESPTEGLAEQVRANTKTKDQRILVMNSIQSVTRAELAEGRTYLNDMRENLDVLRQGLLGQ